MVKIKRIKFMASKTMLSLLTIVFFPLGLVYFALGSVLIEQKIDEEELRRLDSL